MAYGFDDKKKKINVMKKDDIYKITGTASLSGDEGRYTGKRHTITKELYDNCVLVGVEWYEGNTSLSKNLTLMSGISGGINEVGIYDVSKVASPKVNPTKWEIAVDIYNPAQATTKINYTLYFLR